MRPYASVVALLLAWMVYTLVMVWASTQGIDVRNPVEFIADTLGGAA